MSIRRTMTALVSCAVVLLTGVSFGTANAENLDCSAPSWTSVPVQLEEPGLWSYTYQVSWCVEDGRIVRLVPTVAHKDSGTCTWMGRADESETPGGSGAWEVFDMSKFSCRTADGGTQSVTPWGIIIVRPDGTSTVVRKGIGDRIIE